MKNQHSSRVSTEKVNRVNTANWVRICSNVISPLSFLSLFTFHSSVVRALISIITVIFEIF